MLTAVLCTAMGRNCWGNLWQWIVILMFQSFRILVHWLLQLPSKQSLTLPGLTLLIPTFACRYQICIALTKAGKVSFTGLAAEYLLDFLTANFSVGIDFPAILCLRPSTCLK